MAEGPYHCHLTQGGTRVWVGDSITYFSGLTAEDVIVCGSHGGETAALFAAASGAKGVILNDAGRGRENAGISGLGAVEPYAMAAAAVDFQSARIGSGDDTWESGIISACNRWAREAGVMPGQPVATSARLMAAWSPPGQPARPVTPADRPPRHIAAGPPRAIALDSASQVDESCIGAIVVTGSHGGVAGGRPIRAAVAAAFFNDAGVGKDEAGVSRLPLLDELSIPAGTVDCDTARIGDGWDTYEAGVLSHVNATARSLGLARGMPVRRAIQALIAKGRTTFPL